MRSGFLELFTENKPVIGVIHMKGTVLDNVMSHAKEEIKIYLKHGVDGILFDNYCGNYDQLESVLTYVRGQNVQLPIGVHVLHVDALSFHLAQKFSLEFLQVDSVVGHSTARDEHSMQVFFDLYRQNCDAKVIGSLRVGQDDDLAGSALCTDLRSAMMRYDAIRLSGTKEVKKQMEEKLQWFRDELIEFPVILSETNEDNFIKYIELWDVALIDTAFKEPSKRTGRINEKYVKHLMERIRLHRKSKRTHNENAGRLQLQY